mmetsp:Transcript_19697/g.39986  ORF Transcript_19697/g.39986 Transcript_19697/m.39986 type:complete len:116 (+) Transcript_19697:196-543(+)|eukprot:CAMPEP_0178700772 /NCGR_PEP_ID=MMETSP0699-20121125/11873_1 /TAXON_ID=265572 /ORGANISM="Extubocellulus spinifer, Strain CCMP396" /LENGTH=115 /DNA_ID=CAMNT_0020347171 /DNA_START=175 /DNA_END=522 /DNA_ORIENTATION=+
MKLLYAAIITATVLAVGHADGESLNDYDCEAGAACRCYDCSDKTGSYSSRGETLRDCADDCSDRSDCRGFEWTPDDDCELHWDDGEDFSSSGNENTLCCWKKGTRTSKSSRRHLR